MKCPHGVHTDSPIPCSRYALSNCAYAKAPRTEHAFVDGICTQCGDREPESSIGAFKQIAEAFATCDHAYAKNDWCPVCGARHAPTAYLGDPDENGKLIESWVQPELMARLVALFLDPDEEPRPPRS